jgi:ribose-phosphate pyrophosphokinase
MISTGGSISEAARIVRREGAKKIVIAVSHAVFCGPAVERLDACPADKILVTDTIPRQAKVPRQVEVISIAALFGHAILNIHRAESVSSLFEELA